ncbi:hypothetical protein ART_1192 [Arthrobacter sp. PAMC 25486]|uniref:LPXTG cell wall anchor domain-containing protein n=1 Tax=Arthrobacter sp. PAMC 25486 TaxID=1494608 RepID=UPI00053607B6|nr:LPXTG cell wall anchor domain-containing protein [Arthrobacter sp. PAMC 25486]AIY00791.1 hypothetical protein ART_1192 [Arthrobacter sp. PAMC 25486]
MQASKRRPSQVSPSSKRAMTAAVSLTVAAFVFSAALPASANDGGPLTEVSAPATAPQAPADAAPLAPEAAALEVLAPIITSTGLSHPVTSGETSSFSVSVGGGLLGSPKAGGFVFIMANGEPLQVRELVDGSVTLDIRPLANANGAAISILYSGDDNYDQGELELGALEVLPAVTNLALLVPDRPSYSGSRLWIDATVTSDNSAVHGSPDGTIVLTRDGIEVDRAEVKGSHDPERRFAEPGEDLTAKDVQEIIPLEVTNPDFAFGSPDSFELRAHFYPRNGFTEATDKPYTVVSGAAPTEVEIYVGEDVEGSAGTVTGTTTIFAAVRPLTEEIYQAADISGQLRFYADEELVGEVPAEPLGSAIMTWTPKASGTVTLRMEYVPDTLNHVGSIQEAVVKVELPVKPDETKPDEEKPDEVKPDETKPDEVKPDEVKPDETKPDEVKPDEVKPDETKPDEVKPVKVVPASSTMKSTALAQTGAEGSLFLLGGAGILFAGGTLAMVLARRRNRSTELS